MERVMYWIVVLVFFVLFGLIVGLMLIVELFVADRRSERDTARIIAASRLPSMVKRQAD